MIRILNSKLKYVKFNITKASNCVAIGAHHSLILSPDLKSGNHILYALGSNDFGQCGFSECGGNGIFEEEEEDILLEWTTMMHGLEDDKITAISCGDFHSVALTENGIIKTWGSGILGHGNELYDSRPHSVRFFETIGRRVDFISAKSSITSCLAKSKTGFTEAYIWGYLRDQNGNLCKAFSPLLVKHALQLNNIHSITSGFNGSFAILGENNGKLMLQIYNAIPELGFEIPYAPFCKSVPVIDQVYDNKPTVELQMDDSIHSISLGSNAAFFVENNVAKLLDYKSMKIHEITENGIINGTLASNSIFLTSSDSVYSYGFENSDSSPSKPVPFFEFLCQSLKGISKEEPSLNAKSTLELLKKEPKHFKISKSPTNIVASYKEFFIIH